MIKNHIKIAVRNLFRHKAFSFINISGLVIGMAAFLLIIHYVVFELSYDRFNKNADNIYRIRNDRIYTDIHDKSAGCPPALGPTLKREFPEIIETARIYNTSWMNTIVTYNPVNMRDKNSKANEPQEQISFNQDKVFYAEDSFLKMFSFPLLRASTADMLSEPNSAVITASTAKKYFGSDDPIDKTIKVSNNYGTNSYKITGLLDDIPANSHIKFSVLLSFKTLEKHHNKVNNIWGWNAFNTFILLDQQADFKGLESKFSSLVKKYNVSGKDYQRLFLLQPLKDIHLHSNLRHEPEMNGNLITVYFLSIIAIFILLIAWINYINLTTAKSVSRAKEIGVRKVLGSRRIELIKQFLLEAFLLNLISLCITIALVEILLPYFIQFIGKPVILSFSNKIGFWIGLSIVLGSFLSGLYPAFVLSSFNPISVLKGSLIRRSKGIILRKGLVIFQFVISIILIITTIVVYNQLSFMRNQDLGMNIDQTLIIKTPLRQNNFFSNMQKFKDELLMFTSIKNITASSTIPGKEYSNAASGIRPLQSNPDDGKRCFFIDVDEEFFNFYKVDFIAGNNFNSNSRFNESVILNEQAVKILGFGEPENAVNKKVLLGGLGGQIVEVVGIVKDYHHKSLNNRIEPVIFNPLDHIRYFSLKIDYKNINQILALVKNKWDAVFPNQPFEYYFLDEIFNAQYNSDQQFGKFFRLLTSLTIFISCLGLFGLVSFSFAQRTKEIGIRKVLGASAESIVSLLTRELFKLIFFANLIAWPIAYYAMSKWLQNFAYRIDIGWWAFLLAGIMVLAIALITVSYISIKASLANPVESLRYE